MHVAGPCHSDFLTVRSDPWQLFHLAIAPRHKHMFSRPDSTSRLPLLSVGHLLTSSVVLIQAAAAAESQEVNVKNVVPHKPSLMPNSSGTLNLRNLTLFDTVVLYIE